MIVHITGEHDTGKTLAALGRVHPKKVAFFHDDVKDPGLRPEEFGMYVDLVQETKRRNFTMLQMKDYVLGILETIESNEFEGIVFDTWTRFGTALKTWGKANATKFREQVTMAAGGKYLWGQQWGEGSKYEASVISAIASKAPYVCLVTHLKDHYIAEAPTGKQVPDAGKCLDRVCNLRLWLRHNEESGVPISLVLKRLSATRVTKKGLQVINVLPRRIKPLGSEQSVWEAIERYKKEPYGNRLPTKDETPTRYELSILDGILTKDQKEVWRANLKASKDEEAFFEDTKDEAKELAQRLSNEGLNILEIVERLKEEYPDNGYDVGKVGQLLVKG